VSITYTGAEQSAPADGRAAGFRLGLLGLLVALLLVASGSFIWLAAGRLGNEQSDLQAQREQVMNTAEQFMLRLGTHNPKMLDDQGQLPEYRRLVEELSTTKLKTQLEAADFQIAEKLTDQAGLARTTKVFATGVESIDADSATVLVAGQVTDTFSKEAPRDPEAFRYAIRLVQVEGTWLVDSFGRAGDNQ
jgi:Mce-associated membrane protein